MPDKISLAIIGGSGLYNMAGLTHVEEKHISTPFGPPSDPVVVGDLEDRALGEVDEVHPLLEAGADV